MDRWSTSTAARSYRARLRGGPDDGSAVEVEALSDGEPPDFIGAGDEELGMYVLAGLPNLDGSMPYWWIAAPNGLTTPADPASATWTLVSLGEDGETRMWHQHGEDAEPVPLTVESVESGELPVHLGRAYSCSACEDMTVLSRPASATGMESIDPAASEPRHLN